MKPYILYPVSGSVQVIEQGDASQQGNAHVVRLGSEIVIDTAMLDAYCFSSPTDLTFDLMSVIGALKYTDRSIMRRHGEGWGRRLSVEIPVLNKSLWEDREVVGLLKECLEYLTGDEWIFSFKRRKRRPVSPTQKSAPLISVTPHVFIPYSHGLDSFAQVRLLQHREPDTQVVCVFTDSKANFKTWKEFCRHKPPGDIKSIQVPVLVREPHHAEPTFRSRPFTYYLLSAYGALMNGANRVIVPENGQGSLGGSLIPFGSEAPHRSCHPGFTSRLTILLQKLTGKLIKFEHPALFQTKAQVLSELNAIQPHSEAWLLEHASCSHDQRHSNRAGKKVHCGVCGNCILRRVSNRMADIEDVTPYKFVDVNAPTLHQALLEGDSVPRAIKSFIDLATNSVRSMERMSELADDPNSSEIWAEAATIAEHADRDAKVVHRDLVGFLKTHQKEWNSYLAECKVHSWLVKIARG